MLLTGLYPHRTGWTQHHDVPRWGGKGFDWNQYVCWARVLQKAGYATVIGGKWQVNDLRLKAGPLKEHGFDEHCVWPGGEAGNKQSDERYWNPYLVTNRKRQIHKHRYGPEVIADFLVDFIRRHRDQPFLVYFPMLQPHGPHVPTPLNPDAAKNRDKRGALYGGQVTHLDHLVGRIVHTVDELGLTDRTFVLFTSDNGSSVAGMLHGKPYPKGKGKVTNAGANVPFIVRAPFLIGTRAGQSRKDLIDFTDIYPTLLGLAGAKPPAGVSLDGRSFLGLLDGSARDSDKRSWIFSQLKQRMIRDQRFLLTSGGQFFDLRADPRQQINLALSTNPEIVAARTRLSKVLNSLPSDAGPPFPGYRHGRSR
jgi:arylsulfatase A-like enzyme